VTTRRRTALALALLLLAIGARKGRRKLRCWTRGYCSDVQRIYLGLFRCRACGRKGTSLGEFGVFDGGFLRPDSHRWRA
jgi:hypothetical protein